MSRTTEGAPSVLGGVPAAPQGAGAPARGVGARAGDPDTALSYARDLYTRRGEPLSLWVVRSDAVHAASPDEHDPFFAHARHKPYRYPEQFAPLTGDSDAEGSDDDA